MVALQRSIILTLSFFISTTCAVSNSTGTEPPWVHEPDGRGTWGLLFSCVFTLLICVWTAIHDDVIHNGSPWKILGSKIAWMLLAITVPKLVVAEALTQWLKAREIHKVWCKHFSVKPNSKEDLLGMDGAFFVVMGGFTLGPRDHYGNYPAVVSVEDFKRLVVCGRISPAMVNRSLIADKGKSDTVGKLLALTQALSIVIQCVMRKVQGLPVTLLELHVMVQVLCTGIMYGFWWNKPLNVVEPIPLIQHNETNGLLSCFYRDGLALIGIMDDIKTPDANKELAAQPPGTVFDTENSKWFIAGNVLDGSHPTMLSSDFETVVFSGSSSKVLGREVVGQPQKITGRSNNNIVCIWQGDYLVSRGNFWIKYCGLDENMSLCLARNDIATIGRQVSEIRNTIRIKHIESTDPESGVLTALRGFMSPVTEEIASRESLGLIEILSQRFIPQGSPWVYIFLFLYGASHSLAWDSFFPTDAERWLWRICSLILMLASTVFIIGDICPAASVKLVVKKMGYVLPVFVVLASLALVTESFVSLRCLPVGAYKTVSWEDIWYR